MSRRRPKLSLLLIAAASCVTLGACTGVGSAKKQDSKTAAVPAGTFRDPNGGFDRTPAQRRAAWLQASNEPDTAWAPPPSSPSKR